MIEKEDLVNQSNEIHNKALKWHAKRLTIILLSASLLVMVGVGAYMLGAKQQHPFPTDLLTNPQPSLLPSPTSVQQLSAGPTSNWQTYLNEEYGFEIKYPPEWYAKRNDYAWNKERRFLLLFGQGPEPSEFPPMTHHLSRFNIQVSKYQYQSDELQRHEIERVEFANIGQAVSLRQYEPIQFAGVPANRKIQLAPGLIDDERDTQIIFNAKSYAWSITYPNTDYTGSHDQIYDDILSTFKLVN